MKWINQNPAQFSLALIAAFLLAGAFVVMSSVRAYPSRIVAEPSAGSPKNDQPEPNVKAIDTAQQLLNHAAEWQTDSKTNGSLLVSKPYVLDNGSLVSPSIGSFNPPVPNEWLDRFGLNPTLGNILDEDSDGEGFSNLLEWRGMEGLAHLKVQSGGQPGKTVLVPVLGPDGKALPDDSTNPTDPKSHPPYYTRLEVGNIVSIPFRLRFMVANVVGKEVTVQINTMDLGGSNFIGLDTLIPGTNFKTKSYQEKIVQLPDGREKDVSELTVVNQTTGQELVLPKGEIINSPESYAVLRYLWMPVGGQPTRDMNKKKGETFTLPPRAQDPYKVEDIKPLTVDAQGKVTSGEVTITLPDKKTLILKFPAPK